MYIESNEGVVMMREWISVRKRERKGVRKKRERQK